MVAKADVSRTWRSLWRNGRYVGKIGGEGDLAINTVRQVSLSKVRTTIRGQPTFRWGHYVPMRWRAGQYSGTEHQQRGHRRSNGSAQTVETFTGLMGSTVLLKRGR